MNGICFMEESYMIIKVNNKEYKIEYTFEAAHNKKCVLLQKTFQHTATGTEPVRPFLSGKLL